MKIAVLFGGRSGEHEVSLDSARSVLSVLDPLKYDIFQVGITHAGSWLTGPDALQALASGQTDNLLPCTILPDPSKTALFVIRSKDQETGSENSKFEYEPSKYEYETTI